VAPKHYGSSCVHDSLSPVPIPRRVNQLNTLPANLHKINFERVLPSKFRTFKWSHSFGLATKSVYTFLHSPVRPTYISDLLRRIGHPLGSLTVGLFRVGGWGGGGQKHSRHLSLSEYTLHTKDVASHQESPSLGGTNQEAAAYLMLSVCCRILVLGEGVGSCQ
jgi:hypothetical protein